MAGAALLGLQDKVDAGVGDGMANGVGFVADDAVDAVRGDEGLCGGDHMQQKSPAADLMEDFGALAFEAGAFAGSHDDDCEVLCEV